MLNERKTKILQAIIQDYIATAEPVGSRTIAKKYNLGVSSATIRNEMSDLEDMGFILQPHASSGRIPSDLGYRLYVDRLMQKREVNEEEQQFLRNLIAGNIHQIDYLMEETARALALLTNYTTLVSEPVARGTRLKQVRLMPLDGDSLLAVIATEENVIKHHMIHLNPMPAEEELHGIGHQLNGILQGRDPARLDEDVLEVLTVLLRGYPGLLPQLLAAMEKTVAAAEYGQVHLSGAKNILAFPEFSDLNKAKLLFQTLEEKEVLVTLLNEGMTEDIQILIGSENSVESMQSCSVITTTYRLGDTARGMIGILGPTRMDYSQVVSILTGMSYHLEKVLRTLTDGKHQT